NQHLHARQDKGLLLRQFSVWIRHKYFHIPKRRRSARCLTTVTIDAHALPMGACIATVYVPMEFTKCRRMSREPMIAEGSLIGKLQDECMASANYRQLTLESDASAPSQTVNTAASRSPFVPIDHEGEHGFQIVAS